MRKQDPAKQFVDDLQATPAAEAKGESIKTRLPDSLLRRLDRIVDYARDQDRPDVNRSAITRQALEGFIEGVEERLGWSPDGD